MDHHVKEYFRQSSDDTPRGHFHHVIALHEDQEVSWEFIKEKIPNASRGWFELARLDVKDRIEFTHDFWLAKMPYRAGFDTFIDRFFSSLDDIGVYITQKTFDDPYQATLIYSIKADSGFFKGDLPISEKNLANLQRDFPSFILPNDYLAFLQIHDGFCKTTDCTGVTRSVDMYANYLKFQSLLQKNEPIVTSQGTTVDPKTLIPFYESFGMPFYQCFWADWYPEQEMGNVYYSGEAKTISDIYSDLSSSETMAFPTFVDWLMFYLERID
jgi:hypothetical protein